MWLFCDNNSLKFTTNYVVEDYHKFWLSFPGTNQENFVSKISNFARILREQNISNADKERGSKTRTGEKSNFRQRAFNPCSYETGNIQFPVRIYELFCKKRPEESKMGDSPFFLQMVPKPHASPGKRWYYNRPLGKNMLGGFSHFFYKILPIPVGQKLQIIQHVKKDL